MFVGELPERVIVSFGSVPVTEPLLWVSVAVALSSVDC